MRQHLRQIKGVGLYARRQQASSILADLYHSMELSLNRKMEYESISLNNKHLYFQTFSSRLKKRYWSLMKCNNIILKKRIWNKVITREMVAMVVLLQWRRVGWVYFLKDRHASYISADSEETVWAKMAREHGYDVELFIWEACWLILDTCFDKFCSIIILSSSKEYWCGNW